MSRVIVCETMVEMSWRDSTREGKVQRSTAKGVRKLIGSQYLLDTEKVMEDNDKRGPGTKTWFITQSKRHAPLSTRIPNYVASVQWVRCTNIVRYQSQGNGNTYIIQEISHKEDIPRMITTSTLNFLLNIIDVI